MNAVRDPEQLMMDALDGAIGEADRRALQVYLDRHPEERAWFERTQQVDLMLRAEAPAAVPFTLTRRVMDAVIVTSYRHPVSRPALKGPQIAFVIGLSAIIALLVALLILAFVVQLAPPAPDVAAHIFVAFVGGLADVVQSLFAAMIAFLRAAFSQPVTWLISVGMVAIVAVWLRVILAVLAPHLRLVVA